MNAMFIKNSKEAVMVGYRAYQGNQVNTSTPLGLVLLSYEALYKALGRAKYSIEDGDLAAEVSHTERAMEAIIELSTSLNKEAGGEIAENLDSLYQYMLKRLGDGMCSCSTESVDEVILLVATLREGWASISEQQEKAKKVTRPSVAPIPQSMKLAMGYAA